jgi:hypothetical protein
MLKNQPQTNEFMGLSKTKPIGKLNTFFNERLVRIAKYSLRFRILTDFLFRRVIQILQSLKSNSEVAAPTTTTSKMHLMMLFVFSSRVE